MKNRCKDFKNYNLIFFVFFSIRDQSVLVIEDLSEKGFRSKDWFKYKLNHQEVLLSLTELAKFHACGLAYRLIIFRESFCSPFYQKHWHFFLHFGTFSRRYWKYFLLKSPQRAGSKMSRKFDFHKVKSRYIYEIFKTCWNLFCER